MVILNKTCNLHYTYNLNACYLDENHTSHSNENYQVQESYNSQQNI